MKSIHSVEHFHVKLNRPDAGFVEEVTKGDVGVSSRLIGKWACGCKRRMERTKLLRNLLGAI